MHKSSLHLLYILQLMTLIVLLANVSNEMKTLIILVVKKNAHELIVSGIMFLCDAASTPICVSIQSLRPPCHRPTKQTNATAYMFLIIQ